MKIQQILSEDGSGAALAYRQLSPLQIGVLRKIVSNRFDFDNASPHAKDAVEGLSSLGLVDDISLDATERGIQALNFADHLGSVDRRNLSSARDSLRNQGRNETDDISVPDEEMEIE